MKYEKIELKFCREHTVVCCHIAISLQEKKVLKIARFSCPWLNHGVLNQEKYLKSCLDFGPIFFESTTPEVLKTTFREIADFRPSKTLDQTHIMGDSLQNKVQFLKHKPKQIVI